MKSRNVRATLRAAVEEVDAACEADPDVRRQLTGIVEQLRFAADGSSTEPEALVSLERGALDTIQRRVGEVMAEADGEPAAALGRAREHLLLAIVTQEEQWQGQHAGTSGEE